MINTMKHPATTAAPVFRTPYQQEKAEKDMAIAREFREALAADPEASKEAITAFCMNKYKVHSRSGIWAARKRGEAMLQKGGN